MLNHRIQVVSELPLLKHIPGHPRMCEGTADFKGRPCRNYVQLLLTDSAFVA